MASQLPAVFLLRTTNNRYVGLNAAGQLVQTKHYEHETGSLDTFKIEPHGDHVALRLGNRNFLRADHEHVFSDAHTADAHSFWTVSEVDGGLAFRSHSGRYLSVQEDGTLAANGDYVDVAQTFQAQPADVKPVGAFLFKTHQGRYLGLSNSHHLGQENKSEFETGIHETVEVEAHGEHVALRLANGHYIRSDNHGHVLIDSTSVHDNALWTPTKAAEGWAFRSHFNKYLTAEDNGSFTASSTAIAVNQSFQLQPSRADRQNVHLASGKNHGSLSGRFLFRTHHHRYLSVNEAGFVTQEKLTKSQCGADETIEVEPHGELVALKTSSGRYVRANHANILADAQEANESALWAPVKKTGDAWGFKNKHGHFLSAEESGKVIADRDQFRSWESFHLERA